MMKRTKPTYGDESIPLKGKTAGLHNPIAMFVGGSRPYLWFGEDESHIFLGILDNARDVKKLRRFCDQILESK